MNASHGGGEDYVDGRTVAPWRRVEPARWSVQPLLKLTRDLLDMDLVLLTEMRDGREEVRRAEGQWPGLEPGALVGRSLALRDTFCQRLLEGSLPPFVADVSADASAAGLRFARTFGVGAWIGARLESRSAELFVLCCLARESRPALGERDVYVLSTLATSLAYQLDTSQLGP